MHDSDRSTIKIAYPIHQPSIFRISVDGVEDVPGSIPRIAPVILDDITITITLARISTIS